MKKVLAIGGSNSKTSINKKFATYVANQIENTETIIADLNDYAAPIYGIDHENEHGIPAQAKELYDLIGTVDGLVISLAEHNGSYAAAFKSIYDWMSRVDKEVWQQKPMLLLATSPGGRGGKSVLETATSSFPHLGGNIVATFSFPSFQKNFSGNTITDSTLQDALLTKIALFKNEL